MSHHALELVRSKGSIPARYDNFIGGKWVAPGRGPVFHRLQPDQRRAPRRCREVDARDVEAALDAAYKAKDAWARIAPAERRGCSTRSPTGWRRISNCWRLPRR